MTNITAIKNQDKKLPKTFSFGKFRLSLNFTSNLAIEEKFNGKAFLIELSHRSGEIITLRSYLFEMRMFEKRVRLYYYKRKRILRKEDGKDHN
ncbi:hypothetical protein DBR39_12495 [Chryseobacterium sp. KBW03]|nr:hypothetical protein DBR39_12495 [Chryseobacterium sp. KBW03]